MRKTKLKCFGSPSCSADAPKTLKRLIGKHWQCKMNNQSKIRNAQMHFILTPNKQRRLRLKGNMEVILTHYANKNI